jgi:hypothetical protein
VGSPPGTASLQPHLAAFCGELSAFCRYGALRHRAALQAGDTQSSSHMVCCIAMDRDDEFFATAGVSKRIRVYELAGVWSWCGRHG